MAQAITGRLLPAEQASLGRRPTANPVAYDRYLRGNYELVQRTPRSVAAAIADYEDAIRLDPAFSAAQARVAYSYGVFLVWGWTFPGAPPESLLARGLAAADHAIRGDPHTPDAWMARGILLTFRHPRSFEGVGDAFERAIALDPRNAEAHHMYGHVLWMLGKDSASIARFRQALALESERAISYYLLARSMLSGRRYQEAHRLLDSALAVDPGAHYAYAHRAQVRLALGDAAGARLDAETGVRLSPPGYPFWAGGALALVHQHAKDTVAARALIASLLRAVADSSRPRVLEAYWIAVPLVALGDHERALALLEAVTPRSAQLWAYLKLGTLDPLRGHPRFQRLLDESSPRPQ